MVVVSKSQLATYEQIEDMLAWLDELMQEKGCATGLMADVVSTNWDKWTNRDFSNMEDSGYLRMVHEQEDFSHIMLFNSVELKNKYSNKITIKASGLTYTVEMK